MKKTIYSCIAALAVVGAANADVKVGNPMAMTGPIPDLVAPMAIAVDLAEKHINDQGGMFASGEKYVIVRADSMCDPVAGVDAVTKLVNVSGVVGIVVSF